MNESNSVLGVKVGDTATFEKMVSDDDVVAFARAAALGTKLAPPTTVIYLSQSLRFLRPVFPGDPVTARLEVTAVDPEKRFVTCSTECVNQAGQPVLTGQPTLMLA